MKIGIDARMMGKGFGLARYTEQLVLHLLKIDQENEYVLFLRKENWESIDDKTARVKKVLADIPWYSLAEQMNFKKIIKKEKLDLMHFPHWNVPYFYSGPYVVTIHDLIMYHFPRAEATTLGPLKFWVKDIAHRMLLKKIACTAKHFFVTSEFTKNDVHETLGIPFEKMTVTYQAPFESICHPKEQSDEGSKNVLKKYNITKSYSLYVGAAYPHKNLEKLLEAWKIFTQKCGEKYQLVFVGKHNAFYKKIMIQSDILFSQSEKPLFLGFVGDEELTHLYQNASLYVFPSMYEGFGLPPLEAMVHGVPVISSNQTCLPEVLGNAAEYFDPSRTEEMAQALERGLTDPSVRETLQKNARELLKKYSWETLARQTLDQYKGV
jgi:glycosyltransferase involved in cell wall biosynthesis